MTEGSNGASNTPGTGYIGAEEELDPVILEIIEALDSMPDPCCVLSGKNLSIWDLGLINRIERSGDTVTIGITFTDTMCEFSNKILVDIEALAHVIPYVAKVMAVPEVLPIWSTDRLSARANAMIKGDSSRFFKNWDLEEARADIED